MKIRYKFLHKGLKSENGGTKWEKGVWKHQDGELKLCGNGFHCSIEPYDAFSYVQGELLAKVEVKGKHLSDDNKECWSDMRVVKTYKWTKKDSLKLAIFSAELVLPNFEKEYPDDDRPRKAIEAAKKVLFHDTEKNRSSARSAWSSAGSSAWSAGSAWSAARSAGSAAWSAAWSAGSAARSAARSAWSAWSAWSSARSAGSAAWSAAWSAGSAAIKKIQNYFTKLVKELKEI